MPQVEKKLKTKKKIHSKFEPNQIKKNLVGGAMLEGNGGTEFTQRLDFFSQFPYSAKAEEITKMVEETYKETYANRLRNKFIREQRKPTDPLPSMIKKKTLNGKIIDFELYQKFGPTTTGGATKSAKEVFNSNFQEYRNIFNPEARKGSRPSAPPTLDDDIIMRDTSITVCNMHGSLSPDSKNYTAVVPENNIVCFITPINYILSIYFNKKYNLASEFNNMSYELYKELFIQHGNIRNVGFGDTKTAEGEDSSYNCLADCICYYPGQVYPNLTLGLSHEIDYKGKSPFDGIQYLTAQKNKGKISVVNVPDDKFLNTREIKKKIQKAGDIFTYDLNDIINYRKDNLNTKFRITYVIACRYLDKFKNKDEHHRIKSKLLYLELLTYHFNQRMLKELKLPVINHIFGIKSVCSLTSSKTDDFYGSHTYFEPTDKSLLNINIDPRVPNLQKIKSTIDTSVNTLQTSEINYLCNQSLKKLFHFLILIEDQEKRKILVRKLLSQNYHVISNIFNKFLNILQVSAYPVIEEGFEYQDGMLDSMRRLGGLLSTYSGLQDLFISRSISLFNLDIDKLKRMNVLYPDTVVSKTGKKVVYNTVFIDSTIQETEFDELVEPDSKITTAIIQGDLNFGFTKDRTKDRTKFRNIRKLVLGKNFSSISFNETIDSNFDSIFTVFPNLTELIIKDDNIGTFRQRNIVPTLKILRLQNTNVSLNLNHFPALEFLELNQANKYTSLTLSNSNLERIILRDNPKLNKISLKKCNVETLTVFNCKDLDINVSRVETLILSKTDNVNLNKSDISNLEISNTQIRFHQFSQIIPKSGRFSFRKKKEYSTVKFNFIIIGTPPRTGQESPQEIEIKKKNEFIKFIKKFKNINLAYISIGDSDLKLNDTDLANLNNNTITLERGLLANNLQGPIPSNISTF